MRVIKKKKRVSAAEKWSKTKVVAKAKVVTTVIKSHRSKVIVRGSPTRMLIINTHPHRITIDP